MDNKQHYSQRRYRTIVIGSIVLIGAVATFGGLIAIDRIDRQLESHSVLDSGRFLDKSQKMQFHITQAIEEGFAYLVSSDVTEKKEFFDWAADFPNEVAQLKHLNQHQHVDEKARVLLESIVGEQQKLVATAQRLFIAFEQTNGIDIDMFHDYEEVVDRIIGHTQSLIEVGQYHVTTDRVEFVRILETAKSIVLRSSILAALIATILTIFLLRVLSRERAARQEAEKIRSISEQKYLDHYNHAPDMHLSVDADSSKIVECNQTLVDVLGYEKSQMIGKSLLEFYDSGSIEQAMKSLKTFKDTGGAAADHLQVIASNGELLDVSLRVTAVRDEHGRIIRSRSVWRDIRTQVAVEKEIQSSEARYRSLIDSAPVCIHEVDRDLRLINMNAAGLAMLGLTDSAAVSGVPYLDYVPQHDRDRVNSLMKRVLSGESVEYEFESDSSPVREFRASFVPVFDNQGGVDHLIGITQDLTKHRASERALLQKQKMEAVGRLAGGIAHDFNNLLTVVIGYCEELGLLLEAGSRESRYVKQVSLAATQAATLTAQLLAFSRHEKRKPQVLDLNAVITDLEDMLTRVVGEDVTLQTLLESNLSWIETDPGQIQQILVNLVANARDSMPSGGTIRIETRAMDDGRKIQLDVLDTGQGIEPEIREQIFEPFYSTKEAGHGSGLGLATVLGIVEQNNGEIRVDSEVGQGTRVTITFPSVDGVDITAAQPDPGTDTDMDTLSGTETILLAEDQKPVLRLISQALEASGYTVLEAKDGVDALKIARGYDGTIDLLVTDLVMPNMGGKQLSATLSKLRPSLKVIFVSGFTETATPQDTILVGKPYRPSELIRTIRMVLDEVDGERVRVWGKSQDSPPSNSHPEEGRD